MSWLKRLFTSESYPSIDSPGQPVAWYIDQLKLINRDGERFLEFVDAVAMCGGTRTVSSNFYLNWLTDERVEDLAQEAIKEIQKSEQLIRKVLENGKLSGDRNEHLKKMLANIEFRLSALEIIGGMNIPREEKIREVQWRFGDLIGEAGMPETLKAAGFLRSKESREERLAGGPPRMVEARVR